MITVINPALSILPLRYTQLRAAVGGTVPAIYFLQITLDD